jgi:hypothetical protein
MPKLAANRIAIAVRLTDAFPVMDQRKASAPELLARCHAMTVALRDG